MTGYVQNVGGYSNLEDLYATYTPASRSSYVTPADATYVAPKQATVPMANYSEGPSTSGLVGGLLATAAGVGTLCYAAKKGKGEGVIQGFKNIWRDITGKGAKAASEAASSTSEAAKPLSEIKIKMGKDGKPVFYIPGQTTTITNNAEIQRILNENKLRAIKGMHFNTGTGYETTVNTGTFTIKHNGITNFVKFGKDGKILNITNEHGARIPNFNDLVDASGKLKTNLEGSNGDFVAVIDDALSGIRNGERDVIFNPELALRDIDYVTKFGDHVAECHTNVVSAAKGFKPTIKNLKTLKECKANSAELKAFVRMQRESGNDYSALLDKNFVGESIAKGKRKLPSSYKVGEFEMTYRGHKLKVENGVPVSLKKSGTDKWLKKGNTDFEAYLEDYEKDILTQIEKALKDGKIPEGATIIPA